MPRIKVPYIKLKPVDVRDSVWVKLIESWTNGLSDREAVFRVGRILQSDEDFDLNTLHKMYKDHPEVEELRDMLKDDLVASAKLTIAESIQAGSVSTAKWYLERKRADEYTTKASVAFEGAAIDVSVKDKEKAIEEFMEKF